MQKTYLPYDQDQLLLLPPSVREWVEPGDLAHLIDDVVECLDLSAIEAVYEAELRGAPPYHPMSGMLARLYELDLLDRRRLESLPDELVDVLQYAIRVSALTCTWAGAEPPTKSELAAWT